MEVYELPVHQRKYIFHLLKEYYDKQNKQQDSPESLTNDIKSGKIQIPDHFKGKKVGYGGE